MYTVSRVTDALKDTFGNGKNVPLMPTAASRVRLFEKDRNCCPPPSTAGASVALTGVAIRPSNATKSRERAIRHIRVSISG